MQRQIASSSHLRVEKKFVDGVELGRSSGAEGSRLRRPCRKIRGAQPGAAGVWSPSSPGQRRPAAASRAARDACGWDPLSSQQPARQPAASSTLVPCSLLHWPLRCRIGPTTPARDAAVERHVTPPAIDGPPHTIARRGVWRGRRSVAMTHARQCSAQSVAPRPSQPACQPASSLPLRDCPLSCPRRYRRLARLAPLAPHVL